MGGAWVIVAAVAMAVIITTSILNHKPPLQKGSPITKPQVTQEHFPSGEPTIGAEEGEAEIISPNPIKPFIPTVRTIIHSSTIPNPTAQPTVKANPTPLPSVVIPTETSIPVTATPANSSSVHMSGISPSSGKVGDTIIITGSGFGTSSFYYPDPKDFHGMVSFYGPSGQNSGGAPPAEQWAGWWSDSQIKVKVPGVKTGTTYSVEVTSSEGIKSGNRISFTVSD